MTLKDTDLRKAISDKLGYEWPVYWKDKDTLDQIMQLIQDHDKNVRDELIKALPKEATKTQVANLPEAFGYNQAIRAVKAAIAGVYGDGG